MILASSDLLCADGYHYAKLGKHGMAPPHRSAGFRQDRDLVTIRTANRVGDELPLWAIVITPRSNRAWVVLLLRDVQLLRARVQAVVDRPDAMARRRLHVRFGAAETRYTLRGLTLDERGQRTVDQGTFSIVPVSDSKPSSDGGAELYGTAVSPPTRSRSSAIAGRDPRFFLAEPPGQIVITVMIDSRPAKSAGLRV